MFAHRIPEPGKILAILPIWFALTLFLWFLEVPLIYLDTYVLQQDMRIRLPKSILHNLSVEKGISKFAIYFDKKNNSLFLKVAESKEEKL